MSKSLVFHAFSYTAIAAIFETPLPKPWCPRTRVPKYNCTGKCTYELTVAEPKPRPPETQFLVRMGVKRLRWEAQFGEMDWQLPE